MTDAQAFNNDFLATVATVVNVFEELRTLNDCIGQDGTPLDVAVAKAQATGMSDLHDGFSECRLGDHTIAFHVR